MNKWLTVSTEQRDFYLLIDIVSLDLFGLEVMLKYKFVFYVKVVEKNLL